MTHVDCDKFSRDCGNCAHSVRRHMSDNPVQNTLVCLRNACGVRPDQLKATHRTPCGTAIDMIDGLVPRHWKRVSE